MGLFVSVFGDNSKERPLFGAQLDQDPCSGPESKGHKATG